MKKKNSAINKRIILIVIPLFILFCMELSGSIHYHGLLKKNWARDIITLYKIASELIQDDYSDLSQSIVYYSSIISYSENIQGLLKNENEIEPSSLPRETKTFLKILFDQFNGRIRTFELYNNDNKRIFAYPGKEINIHKNTVRIDKILAETSKDRFPKISLQSISSDEGKELPYLLYTSPIFDSKDVNKVIGIFCSWADLGYINNLFLSRILMDLRLIKRPDVYFLTKAGKVLFHSEIGKNVSNSLTVSLKDDLPKDFFSENGEFVLEEEKIGEGKESYYSYTPINMSVKYKNSLVESPGFLLVLRSPKMYMQKQLSSSTVYIIEVSFIFIMLLIIPGFLFFNSVYELQKARTMTLERDMKLAYDIQTSFLPKNNVLIKGYDIYGESKPARQVGGDFYDFIHLKENVLGIVIADVSGKGVSAALMMTVGKSLLNYIAQQESDPVVVLGKLNNFLHESIDSTPFITILSCQLNPEKGSLTYAMGGHYTPVLCRDGKAKPLKGEGHVIGCFANIEIGKYEFQLIKGDILIFYTDGIIDVWNDKKEHIDEEKIWEQAIIYGNLPAKEIAAKIFSHIHDFQENNQQFDDRTLIILKVIS